MSVRSVLKTVFGFSALICTAALTIPGFVSGSGTTVTETILEVQGYDTYGKALAEQVAAGDGGGIDSTFRNSGVELDPGGKAYYAVNGVHPVRRGDYSSYYPKSIVKASLKDDSIIKVYSFDKVNGRDVDMEALTFAADPAKLYIGDEYNFIYELDLASGVITNEWNLADIGIRTNVDKGIEALTYSAETGCFYAGIQGTGEILCLELKKNSVVKIDSFSIESGWAPSGLSAHKDGHLYIVSMRGRGGSGNQMIFKYDMKGILKSKITIPASLGMTRPDGIAFDKEGKPTPAAIGFAKKGKYVFIVDSQGPLYGGYSLYRIPWKSPAL